MMNSIFKINKFTRFCAVSCAILMASSCALAEQLEVKAVGKDLETAQLNAQVNAVRQVMHEVLEAQFLKKHTKELRQIIATADKYSSFEKELSRDKKQNNIAINALVDVNRPLLIQTLRSLGANIVRSAKEIEAERQAIAQNSLDKIFGPGFHLNVQSKQRSPLGKGEPVTREIVAGNRLRTPQDRTEFTTGEIFAISYTRPYAKNTREAALIMVEAGTPMGTFEQTIDYRIQDSDNLALKERMGIWPVVAPLNPGAYEIRMFDGKKDSPCTATLGFTVKSDAVPVLTIDRDVYMPGEAIFVNVNREYKFDKANVILVAKEDADKRRDEHKVLSYSKDFGEYVNGGLTLLELKAPKEEGEYELLVRVNSCDGCEWYTKAIGRTQSLANIPITVKAPQKGSQCSGQAGDIKCPVPQNVNDTFVFVPPKIQAKNRLNMLFNLPTDSEERYQARIYKATEREEDPQTKPRYEISYGRNAGVLEGLTSYSPLFVQPGDYLVEIYKGKEEKPVTSASFAVTSSPFDQKPMLKIHADKYFIDDNIFFDFTVPFDVSDKAGILLVPKGTDSNATIAFEKAGDHRISISNNLGNTYEMFRANVEAGDYEIRMYDRNDEKGRILARDTVIIMDDKEKQKHDDEVDKIIDEYLSTQVLQRSINKEQSIPDYSSYLEKVMAENGFTFDMIRFNEGEKPQYRLISRYTPEERERLLPQISLKKVVNFKNKCEAKLNDKIREMARIDITLGRDSNLQEELQNFGLSMVTEWTPLSGAEKMQTAAKVAIDTINHGVAGLDAISEGDMQEAGKQAALYVIKTMLNTCDEMCLLGMVGKNKDASAVYFASLSDDEFKNVISKYSKYTNSQKDSKKLAEILKLAQEPIRKRAAMLKDQEVASYVNFIFDKGSSLYEATEEVTPNETNSFISVDNEGIKMNAAGQFTTAVAEALCRSNPKCAAFISSAKLAYQSVLATRDFVRDDAVQRTFIGWQLADGDKDLEWMWKGSWGINGQKYMGATMAQARHLMAKSIGRSMTNLALSEEHRERAKNWARACSTYGYNSDNCKDLTFDEKEFSDEEVWNYLQGQFKLWDAEEKKNAEASAYAKSVMNDYKDMTGSCQRAFESWYKSHQKKEGAGTRLWNTVTFRNDECKDAAAMFEAYVDKRAEIESMFRSVLPESGHYCYWRKDNEIRELAQETLCSAMEDWWYSSDEKKTDQIISQKVASEVASNACACGITLSAVDGKVYPPGLEPSARMKEIEKKVTDELNAPKAREKYYERLKNFEQEHDISRVMEKISRKDVLHCLCRLGPHHAAIGGSTFYVGGGRCSETRGAGACCNIGVTGFGVWRSPMASDAEAKALCGYNDALDNYRTKGDKAEEVKALKSPADIRAKIIENDRFLELRNKGQCKTK